jgi:hypothetical protein
MKRVKIKRSSLRGSNPNLQNILQNEVNSIGRNSVQSVHFFNKAGDQIQWFVL